jgi:hypothetical protein
MTPSETLEVGAGESRRVYHLKWPSVGERTQYRHAVVGAGGKRHSQLMLLAALRRGGARLMADLPVEIREASLRRVDALRDALLALISASRQEGANLAELLAQVTASDADLADLESAVREGDARYAALAADNETYAAIAGQVAAHLFLVDWEGFAGPLERASPLRLSEASLSEIPENHFPLIAGKIETMFAVPERLRKKSDSLSAMPSGSDTLKN